MRLPPSRATIVLGALTAAAWLGVSLAGLDQAAAIAGGFIPERMNAGGQAIVATTYGAGVTGFVPAWLTPLTATLVHGGLMHIAFNLLMLGFCGRFVEVALAPRGLLLLYAIGAYAGAAAQYAVDPHGLVPMIGASGAISALLGAYALLFGERRGTLATHRFGKALHVLWLAAAWIGFQLLIGFATVQQGATIAIAAHIGGFLIGLLLARPLLRWRYRTA
ncbi:rhomboid family intramembrane serine protease [Sphingomonas profundi]|uniref:rhomboid family intramembrane serine protease n=1 Tax=Alterirhizorhabdus profundi TaxID=2681549 RepID=UPI0012E7858B|nr:rhomboid family intramembrane serine protease [Sphingomonas profundi]